MTIYVDGKIVVCWLLSISILLWAHRNVFFRGGIKSHICEWLPGGVGPPGDDYWIYPMPRIFFGTVPCLSC